MMAAMEPLHISEADRAENIGAILQRVQTGGEIIVERKTLADFARSVVDARLFRQTAAIARSPCRGVLVIEADGSDLADTGLSRESMQGALITTGVLIS